VRLTKRCQSASSFEPVFVLYLQSALGIGPAKVGTAFGAAALSNAMFHPLVGRAVDRWGARRLTGGGLLTCALMLPIVSHAWSFASAVVLSVMMAGTFAMIATPSLTFMADATTSAGIGSFGTAYGIYNAIWAVGVLVGPALGGYLYERMRFSVLAVAWAAVTVAITISLPILRRGNSRRKSAF
jgi:MFS family permease